jgi:hypothetical protein
MPALSQAQFRAMMAAKEGHSTLGIPQKVGTDFVNATASVKGLPERASSTDRKNHDPIVTQTQKTSGFQKSTAPETPPGNALPTRASTMLEAMTGMASGNTVAAAKKKVRRGSGRHTANPHDKASALHDQLNAAMKAGDHASGKRHALDLANHLTRVSKGGGGGGFGVSGSNSSNSSNNDPNEPQIL